MKKKPNKAYLARMLIALYVCLFFIVLYYLGGIETPGLIYLSLEPLCLVALFAFIYYLFCWLFIACRPRDEVWWKRVDYVWLLFASLALIGQTQVVRTSWFESDHTLAQGAYQSIEKSLKAQINDLLSPESCASAATRYEPADAEQVGRLCERYAGLARPLSELSVLKVLADLPGIASEYSAKPVQDWLTALQDTEKERELRRTQVDTFATLIQPTRFETFFSYFAPLLVVIALALRASKVTGEIQLKAPKQRKFWLIVNQRVVVDSLGFTDVARKRFTHALGSWRKADWGVVHMTCDFIALNSGRGSNEFVAPGFCESEFQLVRLEDFEHCGFAEWAAGQSMEVLYLVGENDPDLIKRLRQWGEESKTEVLIREHI
ncbi:hypothetical protein M1B34_30475 [Pseudomonas sp. MAFF 302030]|uniref:Uncharacterized protein n=1 Tax=Pseudomonas morbosilactucae TaxID=2938197 RepID=A0A9X2CAL8_9PSED|nr:hypothetical protein [Pseudomonas morbosilactucae]MCK9801879.1 hypothetical protein [Pseudomonas morbosilactucae]